MSMNSKFLFDTEFDADMEEAAAARAPTFTETEVMAIKEAAYHEGYQKAELAAKEQAESEILKTLHSLLGMADTLVRQDHERKADQEAATLRAIQTIVAQVMPAYMEKHRADEILKLVEITLADLREEPKMVIRLSQTALDDLEPRLNALIEQAHFQGKIALLADPAFGPGDCRVEWAEGGVERMEDRLLGAVENALHRQLSAYEQQTPQPAADVFATTTPTTIA